MSNADIYREYIVNIVNKIMDEKTLRRIYYFIARLYSMEDNT